MLDVQSLNAESILQLFVRRVEALFGKADEIEARHKKAKALVDKLTQAILTKPFWGEPIHQDANDEPALELRERIKLERVDKTATRPKKKPV
jgi:type I restriction enzyme, S subunit